MLRKHIIIIFAIVISIQFSCQSQNKKELAPSKYNLYELDSNHKDIFGKNIIELYAGTYWVDEPILYTKLVAANQDSFYVLNANACYLGEANTNDSLPLLLFTKNGKTIKKFTYPEISDKRSSHILDIEITDKYIFVDFPGPGMINVYDKNTLKFVKSIRLKSVRDELKIVNNKLYAFTSRMGIGGGADFAKCYEINIDTLTIDKEWTFDLPRGANMTFIHKDIFGVWEKGFYLSDITYYNIKFYDFNKNLLYQINYEPDNWVKNEAIAKKIDSYKKNTSQDFDKFRRDLKELEVISTVEGIYFLNDSTFILKKQNYNKETKRKDDVRLLDIWRLSNNKWKLIYADIKTRNDKTNKIEGLYSDLLNIRPFGNNYFYSFMSNNTIDYVKDEIINTGTYEELYDKNEESILDGTTPRTSFLIYKYIGD